jgi:hypothetical protein
VSNRLLGVLPAKQQETDVWVREDIFDQPLDTEVFGMHGADNRETLGLAVGKYHSKSFAV